VSTSTTHKEIEIESQLDECCVRATLRDNDTVIIAAGYSTWATRPQRCWPNLPLSLHPWLCWRTLETHNVSTSQFSLPSDWLWISAVKRLWYSHQFWFVSCFCCTESHSGLAGQ